MGIGTLIQAFGRRGIRALRAYVPPEIIGVVITLLGLMLAYSGSS